MNATPPDETQEVKRFIWQREWFPTLVAGVIVLMLAILAVIFRNNLMDIAQFGYLGAFVISVLAASTIIIYVPGVPVVFTLGGLLNPVYVGLAAGLGEAIGELTSYAAGYGGRGILQNRFQKFYSRVEGWLKQRGSLVLFISSAVFNPFFDFIGASAGALRFPLWKFFLVCWAGKTVKGMTVAFLGWWGLGLILRWLGISI